MKNIAVDTTFDRSEVGFRYFAKEDGNLYQTVPTGELGEDGKPTYKDQLVSTSMVDAQAALTDTEYKLIDTVVNDERNKPNRITTWLRSLTGNVVKFDGMKHKTYWYDTITGKTASRSTMDLEDDAPGTTVATSQDGVALPLEFADWISNIRRDPTASMAAGFDVSAEKARFCAESVATGLDLRMVNGWGGLNYKGADVWGIRDVPTAETVTQAGTTAGLGWLASTVTASQIFANIKAMVMIQNQNKVPGPYVLMLPDSFRFRMAETYSTSLNGDEKSLWMKILEKPGANIPNVLDISEIKFFSEMDEQKGGAALIQGEAYLLSLDPKWFRVLSYLPMQSFTIGLKGGITTKHRIVEGVCPLFKKNSTGVYGIVKLDAPTE
ncbi:MAG: hypothetical protein D4Q77_00980 [Methanothrix sp.]|nr:MAG: hypothetical protein D4Q77_00980 [Methanothrix sp.]